MTREEFADALDALNVRFIAEHERSDLTILLETAEFQLGVGIGLLVECGLGEEGAMKLARDAFQRECQRKRFRVPL